MGASHNQFRTALGLATVFVLPPLLYLALLELIARFATTGPADVHGPAGFRIGAHLLSVAFVAGIASRLIQRRFTLVSVWFAVVIAVGMVRSNSAGGEPLATTFGAVAGWMLGIGASMLAARRTQSTTHA